MGEAHLVLTHATSNEALPVVLVLSLVSEALESGRLVSVKFGELIWAPLLTFGRQCVHYGRASIKHERHLLRWHTDCNVPNVLLVIYVP